MDDMDLCQQINEERVSDALAEHYRRGIRNAMNAPANITHCQNCEEEIPPARRAAVPGCNRCIDCQTDFENRRLS